MVDRVLLGKGSTTRGTSNYGLWVSRPGYNVQTCTADQLLFSSDADDQVDHALVLLEIPAASQSNNSTRTITSGVPTLASGETTFVFKPVGANDTATITLNSGLNVEITTASTSDTINAATNNVQTQNTFSFVLKGIPTGAIF